MSYRPFSRTVTVDVNVSEVLDDLSTADFAQLARERGITVLSKDDVEELGGRLRRRDLPGVLLLLDQLMPPGFRDFTVAFGGSTGARPC